RVGTGVMRWEEPHHPGPGLQLERHSTPLSPTLQHPLPLQPPLHPPGRARVRSVPEGEGAHRPDENALAAAPAPAPSPAEPEAADDPRGYYFKRLLGAAGPWTLILVLAVVGGVIGAIAVGPAVGAAALVAIVVVGIVVCWFVADSRAADNFFEL